MKKNIEEPEDLDQRLELLEKKLDRLRQLYEQYFLGIEKRQPLQLQQDVVRLIREISNYHIRKTALKFRFSSLAQRFNVHRAYWQRTVREIEEGTYRRDRARANRREIARSGEKLDSAELAKRALLERMKGEEALQERQRRFSEREDSGIKREPYVPAIARKKKRRRKKSAAEIRGAPAEELVERQDELEDAHRRVEALKRVAAVTTFGSRRPERSPSNGEPDRPEGEAAARPKTPVPGSPFGDLLNSANLSPGDPSAGEQPARRADPKRSGLTPASPFEVVGSPRFDSSPPPKRPAGPTEPQRPESRPPTSATASNRRVPSLGAPPGRDSTPAARPAIGTPPARPAGSPPAASEAVRRASSVLESAGLDNDRARRIYEELISARKRCGQPVEKLTYERIVESMARQVPKLRESHGARQVDFEVVTQGDKVFLKPRTK